jgi:predicted NBD/HSP70 family sugar kinase
VVNLTGVEGLVIGGGVYEEIGEYLLPIVADTSSQYDIGGGMNNVRLSLSQLKEDAVALGAILLANQYKKLP